MADEIEQTSDQLGSATDALKGVVSKLHDASDTFVSLKDNLLSAASKAFDGRGFEDITSALSRTSSVITSTSGIMQGLMNDLNDIGGKGASKMAEGVQDALEAIGMSSEGAKNIVSRNLSDIGDMAKSYAAINVYEGLQKGIKDLGEATGINEALQQQIRGLDKEVLSIGTAFGSSFREAQGSTAGFHIELAKTLLTTKQTPEEVKKVRDGLKEAFGSADQLTRLSGLQKAQSNIQSTLNLTNAALLLSVSTGMESGKVAEMMSEAHLDLGESLEGSASMFGTIAVAAQKSGMTFSKVADSIMESARALKMWGGTVGSVSPVFQAFSRALGDGRKGLAVDLLRQYTRGLDIMGFEMRALTGLQAPGGGTRGAIGAGLQMEAALEQGEGGMRRISENLIETIKRFTGGQIVTREQAIENPAMERSFLIQRGLLKQMLNIDYASGTKMLSVLQDIDKHGLSVGGDTESKLGELLGAGEKTQEATTTTLQNAILQQTAAQQTHGRILLQKMDKLISVTGIDEVLSAIQQTLSRTAETGVVDMSVLKNLERFGGQQAVDRFMGVVNKLMGGLLGNQESDSNDIKEGAVEGSKAVKDAVDKLKDRVSFTRAQEMRPRETVNEARAQEKTESIREKGQVDMPGEEIGLMRISMGKDMSRKEIDFNQEEMRNRLDLRRQMEMQNEYRYKPDVNREIDTLGTERSVEKTSRKIDIDLNIKFNANQRDNRVYWEVDTEDLNKQLSTQLEDTLAGVLV